MRPYLQFSVSRTLRSFWSIPTNLPGRPNAKAAKRLERFQQAPIYQPQAFFSNEGKLDNILSLYPCNYPYTFDIYCRHAQSQSLFPQSFADLTLRVYAGL